MTAFGICDNLLVRTLIGYNARRGRPGQHARSRTSRPSVPKPTNGGKTYTFHIKPGVEFSPPVSRQVACNDFVNAMQRLANPKDGGQYELLLQGHQGLVSYAAGKAKSISGIKCQGTSTIVFNLTAPTGDFLKRMGMPATGPQPAEVTKCFEGQAGKYGLDLISTAGYMIQGIDQVDISSCANAQAGLRLRRPDAHGPRAQPELQAEHGPDAQELRRRGAFPDRREQHRHLQQDRGRPVRHRDRRASRTACCKKYATSPSLKPHFFQNSGDRTWYLTMNMTPPPFDDIHVRRAMNWVIDKAALRPDLGRPDGRRHRQPHRPGLAVRRPARRLRAVQDARRPRQRREGEGGDEGLEVRPSGGGMCGAKECKGVLLIADARAVDPGMVSTIQQDAAKIGITFTVAHDQRRVPDGPDRREERPDLRAPRLG